MALLWQLKRWRRKILPRQLSEGPPETLLENQCNHREGIASQIDGRRLQQLIGAANVSAFLRTVPGGRTDLSTHTHYEMLIIMQLAGSDITRCGLFIWRSTNALDALVRDTHTHTSCYRVVMCPLMWLLEFSWGKKEKTFYVKTILSHFHLNRINPNKDTLISPLLSPCQTKVKSIPTHVLKVSST